MTLTINRKICSAGLNNNPNRPLKSIEFITIHCTGNYNATATAKSHAELQYRNGSSASWHYSVDKDEIWQSFEDTSECWHAGDGNNGPGNYTSIGIEICVNYKAGFKEACNNAAWLTSELLKRYRLSVDKVVQHNKWTGKNCPLELRSGAWGVNWDDYIMVVQQYYGAASTGITAASFTGMSNADIAAKALEIVKPHAITASLLPSVKTAQLLLESGYLKSELAVVANNGFGMKTLLSGNTWSGSAWDGVSKHPKPTQEQKPDGTVYTVMADFRKYSCIEDSIKDHSAYLLGAKNGSALRYDGITKCRNYREQAQLIKDGNYATDTQYVKKICDVIEQYKLDKYDSLVGGLSGSLTLVIDGKVLDISAENIHGNFYVTVPELGGMQVKLRDMLEAAGYTMTWEASSRTIVAAKK